MLFGGLQYCCKQLRKLLLPWSVWQQLRTDKAKSPKGSRLGIIQVLASEIMTINNDHQAFQLMMS
jgi:hypothetical protein